jgi:hypothetical protein
MTTRMHTPPRLITPCRPRAHALGSRSSASVAEGLFDDRFTIATDEPHVKVAWRLYTSGISHCSFSTDQQLATIGALEAWVRTGTRSADAFPVSLGFLAGFTPPPWLQP